LCASLALGGRPIQNNLGFGKGFAGRAVAS
jgi:hypothetical protein